MKKIFKICAEFLSLLCIASVLMISCASNRAGDEPKTPSVFVTNLKKINILTAENIEKPIEEVQLFEGYFGEKSFALPLYIQADEKGISISLLNDFGTSMGELTYMDNIVEFNSPVFPENLKAEYIVWDIQLALYRAEEVEKVLAKNKLTFSIENDGETETRKIYDGKTLIEEVVVRKNFIEIKNSLRGYEYHLIGVGDE